MFEMRLLSIIIDEYSKMYKYGILLAINLQSTFFYKVFAQIKKTLLSFQYLF